MFLNPQVSGKLIRKCALGTELVDWLLNLSSIVQTRAQTAGMWQALVEEGALAHGMKMRITMRNPSSSRTRVRTLINVLESCWGITSQTVIICPVYKCLNSLQSISGS